MKTVDEIFNKPCYIIDFLPQQVPKNCGGQFFNVEDHFLESPDRYGIKDRFIRIILKAMCYYPVSVKCGKLIEQPTPRQVTEMIDSMMEDRSDDVMILFTDKDALLLLSWDSLNMSIYNPDAEMCRLFEKLAASEGMFWRRAE